MLWPKGQMAPLVDLQGWRIEGEMFDTPRPAALDLPKSMVTAPSLRLWRSWSPETLHTKGRVSSTPFDAQRYLAIPFYGFPGEVPGNTIELRCITNDKTFPVANMRTNAQWSTAYLRLPRGFCSSQLQLVANAAGTQRILGVGTPFRISPATYYAAQAFPTRALVVTVAWLWFATLLFVCGVSARLAVRNVDSLSAGFVLVGILGLAAFFTYHFSPEIGRTSVATLAKAVPLLALVLLSTRPGVARAFVRDNRRAILLWLIVCWTFAALVSAIDNGGGTWSVNGAFSPQRWSSDNQLPFQFAEAMYDGTPRQQITWGPWQASDRPPLLSGLLLLARDPIISTIELGVNSEFAGTAYVLVALVLLTSWVLPAYRLAETVQHDSGRWVIAIAALSPFFLFNSVYVWPKLLGATFALFALLELIAMRGTPKQRAGLVLAACCASLAVLSHASNALVFPVLALLFLPTIWRQGWIAITVSLVVAVAVLVPWQLWQQHVQPHGNALLRFALAGTFGAEDRTRPILPDILEAYRTLGFNGWIEQKLKGLALMFGASGNASFTEAATYGPGVDSIGQLRVGDFLSLARGIGVSSLGVALLLLAWQARRDWVTRLAAATGLLTVAATTLAFIPEPSIHQLPYAGVAMILLAGALVLHSDLRWRRWAMAIAATYCAIVWIAHPLWVALRVDAWAAAAMIGSTGLLIWLAHDAAYEQPQYAT